MHRVHEQLKIEEADGSNSDLKLVLVKFGLIKGGHAPSFEKYDESKSKILLPENPTETTWKWRVLEKDIFGPDNKSKNSHVIISSNRDDERVMGW